MSTFQCGKCEEEKPITERVNRAAWAPINLPPDYVCQECCDREAEQALEQLYADFYGGHESKHERYLRTDKLEDQ